MSTYRGAGYAGLIGSILILFSLLSAVWGLNDPTLDFYWWAGYTLIWTASLSFCVALGFRIKVKENPKNDIAAALFGFATGVFTVGFNLLAAFVDPAFSYTSSESVWLVMLAPVSETFLFDVAIYEVFDAALRPADWRQIAVASDITFVSYHYFKYLITAQALAPFLIIIILSVGNTLFIYGYHLTKNATAPIVSHTVVNFASQRQQVLQSFLTAIPTLTALVLLAVVVWIVLKAFRRYG